MTYQAGFYSVNSLGEKSLLPNLENNLKAFLSWGFLNIGGYVNVQTPQSNISAFNQHLLRPTKDQNRGIYTTWQSPRKDWVHETGICYNNTSPTKFSGITVNNVFYPGPTGSGSVTYKVDYPNGQIIFTNKIAPTSIVSANYSYKSIQVYKSNDFPSWKEIQLDSSLNTASQFQKYDKGDWSIPAEHRVQLPAVVIETTARADAKPFRLGDRSLIISQDILIHAISDNKDDCHKIVDILRLQEDRFIWLFDTNKVIEDKVYELNFDGSLNVNGKNYFNIVNNPTYQWKLCRISDVTISEIKFYHMNLFGSTIRLTLEIIYDDFDANCGQGGGPVESSAGSGSGSEGVSGSQSGSVSINISTDFSDETVLSSYVSSSMSEFLTGTSDSTTGSVSITDSDSESTNISQTMSSSATESSSISISESSSISETTSTSSSDDIIIDYFWYHCINGTCEYEGAPTWPPDNITYFATLQECLNNCFQSNSSSEISSASETGTSASVSESISSSESIPSYTILSSTSTSASDSSSMSTSASDFSSIESSSASSQSSEESYSASESSNLSEASSVSDGSSANISESQSGSFGSETTVSTSQSDLISTTVSTSASDVDSGTYSTSASDSNSGSTSESQDCCQIWTDAVSQQGCVPVSIIKKTVLEGWKHCGTACIPITLSGNCAGGTGDVCGNSVSLDRCCTPDCGDYTDCDCYPDNSSIPCLAEPTTKVRSGCSCGSGGGFIIYGANCDECCDCCQCDENTCIKSSNNLLVTGCACPDPGPTCTCECGTISTCNFPPGPALDICLDCVACGEAADQLDYPASQAACDACDCTFAVWGQDCVTCCATMETWTCSYTLIDEPGNPLCPGPSCPQIEICACAKASETTVPCKDCKNESFGECGGFTVCKGCDPTAAGC